MAKHIGLMTSTLGGGGAARVMANMANYWARAGHRVSLFDFDSGESQPFYPLDGNVRLVHLGLAGNSRSLFSGVVNNARRCLAIRKALLSERPDVLISFVDTVNVLAILALAGTGIPVIVSERVHPALEPLPLHWQRLRRWAYPMARSVVVQTQGIRSYFSDWRLSRLEVIPNPVKRVAAVGAPADLPRKPTVLAVGRIAAQKNYPLLLRAFARAVQDQPGWKLVIAGAGDVTSEMAAIVKQASIGGEVLFLGQISNVTSLYERADIYALSSLYEGFPNALCEAMASGVASVATDCPGGPSDLIRDGINGVLVGNDDEDALTEGLIRLMRDAELRKRLGERACESVSAYDEAKIMKLWDDVVMGVVAPERMQGSE